MTNFFLFTLGRTGSTAVIDELASHSSISCHGEIFRRNGALTPKAQVQYEQEGDDYLRYRLTNDLVLPYKMFLQLPEAKSLGYSGYLDSLNERTLAEGKKIFGFKLLLNQSTENPGLIEELGDKKFKALHLIRKNVVRKTVSGMVAEQRKAYNRRNYEHPDEKYVIDMASFKLRIKRNDGFVDKTRKTLQSSNIEALEVYYEDFLLNRELFYDKIFDFLGAKSMPLKPSDYSIMVPSLDRVIKNYDEFRSGVDKLGLTHFLD